MKKVLTIVAVLFTLNCSAATQIKFPIFGKKKNSIRCGGKVSHRRSKRQVIKAVGGFVLFVVAGGVMMENGK
jgi:hypothetical protein